MRAHMETIPGRPYGRNGGDQLKKQARHATSRRQREGRCYSNAGCLYAALQFRMVCSLYPTKYESAETGISSLFQCIKYDLTC